LDLVAALPGADPAEGERAASTAEARDRDSAAVVSTAAAGPVEEPISMLVAEALERTSLAQLAAEETAVLELPPCAVAESAPEIMRQVVGALAEMGLTTAWGLDHHLITKPAADLVSELLAKLMTGVDDRGQGEVRMWDEEFGLPPNLHLGIVAGVVSVLFEQMELVRDEVVEGAPGVDPDACQGGLRVRELLNEYPSALIL
jgi:hypothetical protein